MFNQYFDLTSNVINPRTGNIIYSNGQRITYGQLVNLRAAHYILLVDTTAGRVRITRDLQLTK